MPTRRDDYPYFLGFAAERGWGAGEGYTRNFPLPPGTDWSAYGPALDAALATVRSSRPMSWSSRSASTPRSKTPTRSDSSPTTTRASALPSADSRRPTVFVQEGGYDLDVLGRNVVTVLRAAQGA